MEMAQQVIEMLNSSPLLFLFTVAFLLGGVLGFVGGFASAFWALKKRFAVSPEVAELTEQKTALEVEVKYKDEKIEQLLEEMEEVKSKLDDFEKFFMEKFAQVLSANVNS